MRREAIITMIYRALMRCGDALHRLAGWLDRL